MYSILLFIQLSKLDFIIFLIFQRRKPKLTIWKYLSPISRLMKGQTMSGVLASNPVLLPLNQDLSQIVSNVRKISWVNVDPIYAIRSLMKLTFYRGSHTIKGYGWHPNTSFFAIISHRKGKFRKLMSDPLIEYQRLVNKMLMEVPSLVTTQIQITTLSI